MSEQRLKERLHEARGKANARPCHGNDLTVCDLELAIFKIENRRLKRELEKLRAGR